MDNSATIDMELMIVLALCLSQMLNVQVDQLFVRSIRKVPLWELAAKL